MMLIKFFGGTGGGGRISTYLVDPGRPGREGAVPEVLRGDIDRTKELIDSIDRKWSYSTGVISFALEDNPTVDQQNALMADFERLAFAGLPRDRYDITWVRHSHTDGGRIELHFLVPRMDLATGKSFNIAPPGWERTYAPLRDAYNYEHGWARPDDPARARTQQRVSEGYSRFKSREAITAYLEQKIVNGEVEDRLGLVSALHEAGLEIPRLGKSYVTALDPVSGERWRLKGRIYEKDWTRDAELDRAASREVGAAKIETDRVDVGRAAEARERFEAIIERRAAWVGERYREPAGRASEIGQDEKRGDQPRSDGDPRETKDVVSDQRSRGGLDSEPVLERPETVGHVAAQRSQHRDQRDGNVFDPAGEGGTGMALWRKAVRKIGGLNDREIDVDRTGALERIRELGSRIRGFGEGAITSLRNLFRSDQDAERTPEPARRAFEQSERSLGTAEQINDRLDRENAAIEHRLEVEKDLLQMELEFERQRVRELER